MITSKQRSILKGIANSMNPIFQIGKSGVTPEFTNSVSEALEKRELIKLNILSNCVLESKEIADILSERTKSDIVQIIGKKIILYKPSEKSPSISINI